MGGQVWDEQGTAYPLGILLGEGGQGQVFEVPGKPSLAIKRFYGKPSGEGGRAQLQRKVTALQAKRLDKFLPQAAWPQFPVYTEQREWCGYAMRKVKGVPLLPALFLNPARLEKKFPQVRRPDLCALALELLKAVEFLQEEGVAIGDYNPLNFRYDLQRKQLGLLDTDAFQVRHDGSVIPCPVTSPEMTLPELLNTRVRHHYRSLPTELFSAALMAFLILMPGRHPYDAAGAQEIADNLRLGRFPYRPDDHSAGPPTGLIPPGIWPGVGGFPSAAPGTLYRHLPDRPRPAETARQHQRAPPGGGGIPRRLCPRRAFDYAPARPGTTPAPRRLSRRPYKRPAPAGLFSAPGEYAPRQNPRPETPRRPRTGPASAAAGSPRKTIPRPRGHPGESLRLACFENASS